MLSTGEGTHEFGESGSTRIDHSRSSKRVDLSVVERRVVGVGEAGGTLDLVEELREDSQRRSPWERSRTHRSVASLNGQNTACRGEVLLGGDVARGAEVCRRTPRQEVGA